MNGIDSLLSSSGVGPLGSLGGLSGKTAEGDELNFSDVLGDVYSLAENTEAADQQSVLSLLTGNVNDISSVMIDSEKAEIALSLTIEIRNKLLDAYNEIMNMQV
jgi:flagellar hook-basal body complex protein FliE